MTFEQIIENLQKKIYSPVYLLSGEEAYYIDKISDFIEQNVLTEDEKEFNFTVLYGRDTKVQTIVDAAKRYPMMSNYQVVIVKEAQQLDKIEELAAYVSKPLSSTILVLGYKYGKIDKRKSFYKQVEKTGVFFESPKLWDNQVPAWIANYAKEKGCKIDSKSSALLTESLGNDLSKIANEIDKLVLNMNGKKEITPELIEQFIGISKDYNVFELQKALVGKDIIKANKIIHYFGQNTKEHPIQMLIPILYGFFLKLLIYQTERTRMPEKELLAKMGARNSYEFEAASKHYSTQKTARIIGYFREYDLKSKGMDNASTSDPDLMRELIFKILH